MFTQTALKKLGDFGNCGDVTRKRRKGCLATPPQITVLENQNKL